MTTYAAIHAALERAEAAGLPVPSVNVRWHYISDDEVQTMVASSPEADWKPASVDGSAWVTFGAVTRGLSVGAFLDDSTEAATLDRAAWLVIRGRSKANKEE